MKDVEFVVNDKSGRQCTFKSFDKAASFAVRLAASDGEPHDVDVLVWSRAGARAFAGYDGVGQYEADPDASVFERVTVRAEAKGRIP